ncbi:MAG: endonuclease/exonuclease/phosphatase family protein [Actinomycetota bacterium]|nr:endonuclease/exonuclease/phosphatase family protein [Actinomycetota bacterium]
MAAAPRVLGEPPADVAASLKRLANALDREIPAKRPGGNLLIATWNIRAFGDLTEKWRTGAGDTPKRNLHDVRAIAEIVSRFDVVALQEVRGNIKALRHTLKALGPQWAFILTDVTRGSAGNDERLAFVFDLGRVKPSGLACELVVPDEQLRRGVGEDALRRQFARTPYAVSFQAAGSTFILVTLHVLFGKKPRERVAELRAIAEWLAEWAAEVDEFNQNLMALGDFNIDRRGDPNYEAFASTGLRPPDELDGLSRTIFDDPGKESFFDQIAWFAADGRPRLSLEYTHNAGRFEWTRHVLERLRDVEKSWRISDHYPLWAEFSLGAR